MKLTIKLKIQIAIAVIITLVSSVQAWISISQLTQQTASSVQHQMQSISLSTSRNISDWIRVRAEMMQANQSLIGKEKNADRELLLTKRAGQFLSVYAGFENGEIAYGDKTETFPKDYDPRTRQWYKDAINHDTLILTEPYRDFDGSMVVSMAQSFEDERRGVLAADLTINEIIERVLNLELNNNGFAFLVDGKNNIVAYRDESLTQKPLIALDSELTPGLIKQIESQRSVHSFIFNDREHLIYATPIEGTQWTLALVEDQTLAYSAIGRQIRFIIFASLSLIVFIAVIGSLIINNLLRPLSRLNQSVEQLTQGQGDLTQRIKIERMDEIGVLGENMNLFLEQLQNMIKGIVEKSNKLGEYAKISAQQTEISSQKLSEQQNDINQIATAIYEMSATSSEVASHAEMTASATQASTASCEEGQQIIGKNREAITALSNQLKGAAQLILELENNAQGINHILSTIQGIAEQTNLLALNAAIEAARAGEQGRGFAVVADEVRVLSQRTHVSTEEIRRMIDTLQEKTRQVVESMQASTDLAEQSVGFAEDASESLHQITSSMTEISDMAIHIASAAEEQRAVSEDISANTQAVKDVSDIISKKADEVRKSTQEIHRSAASMRDSVSCFRI